jgi:hypothetical protein
MKILTTKQIIEYKPQLKSGDVLHCTSNGVLGKLIQKFTKSKINHTALVIEVWGELFICDSQIDGTNLRPFEEWVKKYNYTYSISRPLAFPDYYRERAMSKIGHTPYDLKSLFITQPIYQLTGKWVGRPEERADTKMYCSEYVSWVFNLPEWWKNSPQKVFEILSNSDVFYFIE